MRQHPLHEDGQRKWILVANRAEAKIFAADRRLHALHLIQEIPFPEGRRQDRDIDADDHGSRFSAFSGRGNGGVHGGGSAGNQQKHGVDGHEAATEHRADVFARDLGHLLQIGRSQEKYEELVLVAEPHFLGKLRNSLDKETANRVVSSIHHNLMALNERDLRERLKSDLPDPDRVHFGSNGLESGEG